MIIPAPFTGLVLYLEWKTTVLEDCHVRCYLVNEKRESDENLQGNTEAQPQAT